MFIRVINTSEEFLGLEGIWNDILKLSGSNHIQLTHQWLYTWWCHFSGSASLFILLAEEGGKTIGIAPLMIVHQGRFVRNSLKQKVITFIGLGFTDFCDMILDERRDEVFYEFMKFIMQNEEVWDEVDLRQINTSSPNYQLFNDMLGDYCGFKINMSFVINSPRLPIEGSYDDYYSRLASLFRKQIGRYNRKLRNEGALEFEVVDEVNESHINEICELNRKRNLLTNRRSIFLQEKKLSFIRDIVENFNKKKWIKLFILRFNGNIISYDFTFNYGERIFDWNTSFDLDFDKYSVGRLLNNEIIKYCFDNNYKVYDLMVGDEEYKLKWTKTIEKNYLFTIQKNNFITLFLEQYNKVKQAIKGQQ